MDYTVYGCFKQTFRRGISIQIFSCLQRRVSWSSAERMAYTFPIIAEVVLFISARRAYSVMHRWETVQVFCAKTQITMKMDVMYPLSNGRIFRYAIYE